MEQPNLEENLLLLKNKITFSSNLGELIRVTGVQCPDWEMPQAETKVENTVLAA